MEEKEDSPELKVERILGWYYRNSGCRISKAYSFRVKLWYFFNTGRWMRQKIHTTS
jgi:hypothetical protein